MKMPIRILQITGGMNMGGIENFIMNIYRNIDRERVQFDFLIHQEEKQIFEDEIEKLGGKIYRIPSIRKSGYFKYKKNLKEFFQNYSYKIVHSHYNELSGIILKIAKDYGVKVRISHSHIAYPKYSNILTRLFGDYLRNLLKNSSSLKFACSNLAGEWLYEKNGNYEVINNGIEANKYKLNEKIKIEKREELKIEKDEIAIGHIGRLTEQKNHKFLIEIFSKLHEKNSKYKLFIIGNGELEEKIREHIKALNLEKNIIMLGVRKDVNKILQAMDLFVFPSLYEGLPVTLVEAQGAGLKCFISDTVTKEIDLECGLTEFISLDKTSEEWADIIDKNKEYIRKDTIDSLKSHGYDMTENAKNLEIRYIELYNKA